MRMAQENLFCVPLVGVQVPQPDSSVVAPGSNPAVGGACYGPDSINMSPKNADHRPVLQVPYTNRHVGRARSELVLVSWVQKLNAIDGIGMAGEPRWTMILVTSIPDADAAVVRCGCDEPVVRCKSNGTDSLIVTIQDNG